MTAGTNKLDESFHSMGDDEEELLQDEDDDFFDAQDYFDAELVDQVERLASKQMANISEKDEDDDFMEHMESKRNN
jgi:hypothetical protein